MSQIGGWDHSILMKAGLSLVEKESTTSEKPALADTSNIDGFTGKITKENATVPEIFLETHFAKLAAKYFETCKPSFCVGSLNMCRAYYQLTLALCLSDPCVRWMD